MNTNATQSLRQRHGVGMLAGLMGLLTGCQANFPRVDPTGQSFPAVVGSTLEGVEVKLPADLAGRPVVLLVGYEMKAQFDIDRWLLGLQQAGVDIPLYEVPTIVGMVPGMIAGKIDGGMRRGIPQEDWASVITVYGDAKKIARFTGNDDRLTGRVLLLDGEGRVVFFHDQGYSVSALARLREKIGGL
ncbi:MAG: hypothetical protein OER86_12560 [Phycisphaerae bacterium]|nr:hypothetical protein [Phycisphaerae bacterium]